MHYWFTLYKNITFIQRDDINVLAELTYQLNVTLKLVFRIFKKSC